MENNRAFAEILNDCLDAMESGEASVEDCLARYPGHAARLEGLLRLGDEARGMPVPAPTPERLAAGEERLLRALQSKEAARPGERSNKSLLALLSDRLVEPVKARVRSWPKWAAPALAVSGSMALLFACALVIALGAGVRWWAFRDKGAVPGRTGAISGDAPSDTPETVVAQRPAQTPEMGVAKSPLQAPTRTPEMGVAQSPVRPPEGEAPHVVFLPFVNDPLPPDRAILRDVRGVVELRTDGQPWAPVGEGQIVGTGQRVRTGALSGARIAFYDGSTASLGPDGEISLDRLGEDASDGSRIIELSQWVGESDHDVAPARGDDARYEVHTPSGTGIAMGTSFRVLVVPDLLSRFSVNEGAVAVTNAEVQVTVVAGQLTNIPVDRPPSEPLFRVTGEGEVTEIGAATWTIAGQVFSTHEHTVIVGDPQVGDWVHVEGHLLPDGTRVADRIVLLRRSPADRFTIVGEVEAMATDAWTVAGQIVLVSETTDTDDGVQVGDRVRVDGVIGEGGTLVAESIRLIEARGIRFSFVGVVEEIANASCKISGVSIAIDAETVIDDALAIGDLVRVRGVFLEDGQGTWLARTIERVEPPEYTPDAVHRFEFVGFVESIDPWVVSGIAIETRMWTEIVADKGRPIAIGDRVKVEGWILPDGTWLADEIVADRVRPPEAKEDLSFEFVGRVQSIEPWIVGGISLTVDHRTEIVAPRGRPIVVGDRVKVEGQILPDGEWLAIEIVPVEDRLGRGCVQFTALVVRIDDGRAVLRNGANIPVGGNVPVEGEIRENSVILFYICVDDQGRMTVVRIIVLYYVEPGTMVPATPAPPRRPSPPPTRRPSPRPGSGGSIVVTENNQTRTYICDGHSVTIKGNANTITLLGSCGPVTIRGNSNWVSIRSATSVTNTGNNNTIVRP